MNDFLNHYDWTLTSQLMLVCGVSLSLIFYRRLKNYNEELVSIPFSLCLGISIFTSSNLIAFIFFSEIAFNLSNILYKGKHKQYNSRHFENIRYFFWIILIFCHYRAFNTFHSSSVPDGASVELAFVCVLLIGITFIQLLKFLLRRDNGYISLNEVIGYDILTVLVFSLKAIYMVSKFSDFLEPQHHRVVDILLLMLVGLGSLLSLRFLRTNSVRKINSVVTALVILSLFPILALSSDNFRENFTTYSILIVLSFMVFELTGQFLKVGRFKALITFILFCVVTGLNPFGYFHSLFKNIVNSNDQVLLLSGVFICAMALALSSKRLFELSIRE